LDSYRGELSGLYGITLLTYALAKVFHIESGAIEVGCDGETALFKCFKLDWVIDSSDSGFDLIRAIRQMVTESGIVFKARHIKGHQDDLMEYDSLDRWARLNCDMDVKAKAHCAAIRAENRSPIWKIYKEPWRIWIGGRKICKDVAYQITDHIHGSKARKYWDDKRRFGLPGSSAIDWETVERAMSTSSFRRRQWVTKHTSGFCGTGKMMKLWKQRSSAACPRCGVEPEDVEHVWKCQDRGAKEQWTASLQELSDWLTQQGTCPDTKKLILGRLDAWRNSENPADQGPVPDHIQPALEAQDGIGWRAFLEGCFALDWVGVQQQYFNWQKSRRTGRRWAVALVRKLWDVAWDQWEHRNGVLHARDTASTHQLLSQDTDAAIIREYRKGQGHLPRSYSHLFRQPLLELMASPLPVKRQWVAAVQAAREHFKAARREQLLQEARAARTLRRQQELMAQFFIRR
jgi:hypothetical protein